MEQNSFYWRFLSSFILLGSLFDIRGFSSDSLFKKIHATEDGDAIDSSLIHSEFSKCSIKSGCYYVVRESKSANLKSKESIDGLSNYYEVWKKMTQFFADCKEAQSLGMKGSGIINIRTINFSEILAPCDMITNGGGWTIFQRRVDGTVNFNRDWKSYKNGFGNINGSFWLGLEALHQLTSVGNVELRVDLKRDDGAVGHAEYSYFRILNENAKYQIEFGDYQGNIGNSLRLNNKKPFSTYDNDNDEVERNCAEVFRGGWWHNACFSANLNNEYYNSTFVNEERIMSGRMSWKSWNGHYGNIIFSEMKLRRSN